MGPPQDSSSAPLTHIMGFFNRIKGETDEGDMNRILPDINEDITVHGCAVYFDVLRLCQSIPGRLKGWYRYGEVRDCSPIGEHSVLA